MVEKLNKADVAAQLTKAGIKFTSRTSLADMVKLLPAQASVPGATDATVAVAAKAAVAAQLTKLGVSFDPTATIETLQALLDSNTVPQDPRVPKAGSVADPASHGFDVIDPEEITKRVLPFIILPGKNVDGTAKEWANPSSVEFAGLLNAYAYQNPKKWGKKKPTLLSQLATINNLPAEAAAEELATLKGTLAGVSFPNKFEAAKK